MCATCCELSACKRQSRCSCLQGDNDACVAIKEPTYRALCSTGVLHVAELGLFAHALKSHVVHSDISPMKSAVQKSKEAVDENVGPVMVCL